MKNKGFTLIELLGVIVILALLVILVFPSIINSIKKSSNEKDELVVDLIYNATDIYISKNKNNYPKNNGNVYCIPLTQLIGNDYLKEDMLNIGEVDPSSKTVKITVTDKYNYEIVDNDKCEVINNIPKEDEEICFETKENKDGTLTINGYTCSYTDVVIPDTIDGKTVTVIGSMAFWDKNLTSVVLPQSLVEIKFNAFELNSLSEVNFPETLETIGGSAFSHNDLLKLNIPNNVTSIGENAFAHNELSELKLSNKLKTIGGSAFADNKLSNINIPTTVTYIGGGAFYHNFCSSENWFVYNRNSDGSIDYTSLNSFCGYGYGGTVTIPETVTYIDYYAFFGCKLWEVLLPSKLVYIGDHAFRGNNLENITIPSTVTHIGQAAFVSNNFSSGNEFIYNRNSDGSIDYTFLNSYGGTNKKVIIPSGVTKIGEYAFFDRYIKSVEIPTTVTEIGRSAFKDNSLTSVTIPESVKIIGGSAFSYNKLTSVIIKGKSGPSDFTEYGSSIWGWASGYSDSNITWNG